MGASVLWKMGSKSGEIPLRLQVSRIGRRPECDVSLDTPELPEHALSIWFEDGRYILNNVSDRTYTLDGAELQPRESLAWRPEGLLTLGDGITVTLRVRGDPAPSATSHDGDPAAEQSRPPEQEDESLEEAIRHEQDEEELPEWLKSFRYEYLVILACFLVIPFIWTSGPSPDQIEEYRRLVSLESEVFRKLGEERSNRPLIEIRALIVRGHSEEAREEHASAQRAFWQAKNLLLQLQAEDGSDPQFLEDIGEVLKMRIAAIEE